MTLFCKINSKLCVLAKIVFLGIAGKNSRFSQMLRTTYLCRTQIIYGTLKGRYEVNLQEKINQKSLTYRDSVMVIFRFLGQNGLKLELRTFAVHKILMEH